MSLILAIDPSLTSTGWCIMDKCTMQVIACDKIQPNVKMEEDDRIYETAIKLVDICKIFNIKEAAMESQYVGRNKKVALQLSRVRSGISILLKHYHVKTKYYEPDEPRAIVIKGDVKKEEVATWLTNVYSDNIIVMRVGPYNDNSCKKKTSDIYDAILIGRAYCYEYLYYGKRYYGKAS